MTDNTVCNLGNIKGEKGDKGEKGEKGDKGADGKDGKDGRGIAKTELVNGELVITYTDGTSDNLGSIGGDVTDYTSMLTFTILDDGTLSVSVKSDYQNSIEKVVIPSTYNGRKVTVIAEKAFYNCKYLKNVTIPNTVTQIGNSAFCGTDLTYLNMGDGVVSIGKYAFTGCENLKTFSLSKSLKSIGDSAFTRCKKIDSMVLPDGVEDIGANAFHDCNNLTSINIPKSVTRVGRLGNYNNWQYVYFEDPTGWKMNYNYKWKTPDANWHSIDINSFSDPEQAAKEFNTNYFSYNPYSSYLYNEWEYVKK